MNAPDIPVILREGVLNGIPHRLERRWVRQDKVRIATFIIFDDVGGLYGFLDRTSAECHWRSMGIRALAQQEAA
jgi:hypothetical protein